MKHAAGKFKKFQMFNIVSKILDTFNYLLNKTDFIDLSKHGFLRASFPFYTQGKISDIE